MNSKSAELVVKLVLTSTGELIFSDVGSRVGVTVGGLWVGPLLLLVPSDVDLSSFGFSDFRGTVTGSGWSLVVVI